MLTPLTKSSDLFPHGETPFQILSSPEVLRQPALELLISEAKLLLFDANRFDSC
jgi:hypothetical protein